MRLLYYVNPISFGNMVGLGTAVGAAYYLWRTRNTFFIFPTYYFTQILFGIHVTLYVLIVGTFLYQILFGVFRYFNETLIPPPFHWVFEGCVQFMFGLCMGGILVHLWNLMMAYSTCILDAYCTTPTFMRRVSELRGKVCKADSGSCTNFFYNLPPMFQTTKSVILSLFIIYIWERAHQPLEISIKVVQSKKSNKKV